VNPKPRLALFQPDIPQNTGAMLRLAACLDVAVDVIGPTGFVFGDRRLRRAGMDYAAHVALQRHDSWEDFLAARAGGRLVLMTTKAGDRYTDFAYRPGDTILMGSESAGVPGFVHAAADARLVIPLAGGMRSLNVAQAAAMALGEALRQIDNAAVRSLRDRLETTP
jgi:tRNA (cytidine/uridine-2'-O-)-methyltransferase